MAAMIEVVGLRKNFRVNQRHEGLFAPVFNLFVPHTRLIEAVAGIDFTIQRGELVGYLGPNGAGKSTTLKMLTGLLVPSGGQAVVAGRIPHQQRQEHVAHIGAVFGQRTTLWWDLPVIESLELLQHMYRIPAGLFRRNLDEFCELLELGPFMQTPVRSLSLGQRMRADICAALLHNPDILFLDEPTIGLDVVAKERIRQFIHHIHRDRQTTVLLTTHDLSDVEKLCERVLIIDQGRLLFDGALHALQDRFGGRRTLVVDFAEDYGDVCLEGLEPPEREGLRAIYHFERGVITASELINCLSARFRLRDLQVREPAIEDTIRRIYEGRLLEQGA